VWKTDVIAQQNRTAPDAPVWGDARRGRSGRGLRLIPADENAIRQRGVPARSPSQATCQTALARLQLAGGTSHPVHGGNFNPGLALKPRHQTLEDIMGFGKGALLWLLGIPLPIIILLALFWR
jgi:hypothetical protein